MNISIAIITILCFGGITMKNHEENQGVLQDDRPQGRQEIQAPDHPRATSEDAGREVAQALVAIKLTKGAHCLVDQASYEELSKFNWHLSSKGYAARSVGGRKDKKIVYMHRLLLGNPTGVEVDHRDRNKLNNSLSNLRCATRGENARNLPLSSKNKSGLKGVSWRGHKKRPWRATITVLGKQIHLGSFATKDQAGDAYKAAAIIHHGKFASI